MEPSLIAPHLLLLTAIDALKSHYKPYQVYTYLHIALILVVEYCFSGKINRTPDLSNHPALPQQYMATQHN